MGGCAKLLPSPLTSAKSKAFNMPHNTPSHLCSAKVRQRVGESGASLVLVLLILVVVSILGVGAAQISLMAERGSRNDRDKQVAWSAAEAALLDAQSEILSSTSIRYALFDGTNISQFVDGCGTSGNSQGLCAVSTGSKPAWLTVDFTDTSSSAATAYYGQFTGRSFAVGNTGLSPSQKPRYIIELVRLMSGSQSDFSYAYRITAMGFGPRTETQSVMQIVYQP